MSASIYSRQLAFAPAEKPRRQTPAGFAMASACMGATKRSFKLLSKSNFMNTHNIITVTCPSCSHEFPLSGAVLGSVREGVRKELSAEVLKREQSLESKLQELRTKEELIRKQALDLEVEVTKKLNIRLKEVEARARQQWRGRWPVRRSKPILPIGVS